MNYALQLLDMDQTQLQEQFKQHNIKAANKSRVKPMLRWRLFNPETGEVLETKAKTQKGAMGIFSRYINYSKYFKGFTELKCLGECE